MLSCSPRIDNIPPVTFGYRDIRWNSWRWRPLLERWGHLRVLIDSRILTTATFLCVEDQPCSTVFFVVWPLSGGVNACYAVTTRHSIRSPIVSIRFNLINGGTEDQSFLSEDWIKHPLTDVAVLPLELPRGKYVIDYIRIHDFAGRDHLNIIPPMPRMEDIAGQSLPFYGAGAEVFTVGLFEGHTGQHLAQPVARFGHIALKPGAKEKIFAEIDPDSLTPVDALLVEMAVWHGQSGSPVFLHVSANPSHGHGRWGDTYCLIGMLQGFYPGEQDVKIDGQDATLSPLQMGIGIVIPAEDIRKTLSQQPLEEQRRKLKEQKQQNPTIRPSAAVKTDSESD